MAIMEWSTALVVLPILRLGVPNKNVVMVDRHPASVKLFSRFVCLLAKPGALNTASIRRIRIVTGR